MGEEEVDALRSEVCTLESRLENALSDLRRWEDRAYSSEADYEASERRASDLKEALGDAEIEIADKDRDYAELSENYHDLETELDRTAYERDCYKEVLKGMEFIEIDSYPEKGAAFCSRLGTEAKETIETVINKALENK